MLGHSGAYPPESSEIIGSTEVVDPYTTSDNYQNIKVLKNRNNLVKQFILGDMDRPEISRREPCDELGSEELANWLIGTFEAHCAHICFCAAIDHVHIRDLGELLALEF